MDPPKLFELLARLAQHSHNFSIQTELVYAAGKCIGTIQDLIRWRGNANRPRCARRHRSRGLRWLVADRGSSVRIQRHVDGDLAEELTIAIKNLDSPVATVRHIDITFGIDCKAMRSTKLAGLVAGLAPGLDPVAILIN